jgi:hypothetical protein
MKKKKKKKDFYSRLVLPTGSKSVCQATAQLTLYFRLVLLTGSKSPPFLPVVNLYFRKRTFGWSIGSKGVAHREYMSFLY